MGGLQFQQVSGTRWMSINHAWLCSYTAAHAWFVCGRRLCAQFNNCWAPSAVAPACRGTAARRRTRGPAAHMHLVYDDTCSVYAWQRLLMRMNRTRLMRIAASVGTHVAACWHATRSAHREQAGARSHHSCTLRSCPGALAVEHSDVCG